MASRGTRVSAEGRARMSRAQIERHRLAREARVVEPDHKRCSKCREVKPVAAFSVKRIKLKSGPVSIVPESWCKRCKADWSKAWRERLKAEGVDMTTLRRRWAAGEDPEHRRRRKREEAAAKRRAKGVPERGPWLKYRDPDHHRVGLDAEPLARFLEGLLEHEEIQLVADRTGIDPRRLFAIRRREFTTVTLAVADRLLTGLGCPEQLPVLYPDLSVGYHIVPSS